MVKIGDLIRERSRQVPTREWIPIGARVFEGPELTPILEDVWEIPPLLEQAALAESRSEGTRLNRGYFEVRVAGKFHEYWAVGLPWIPDVDDTRVCVSPTLCQRSSKVPSSVVLGSFTTAASPTVGSLSRTRCGSRELSSGKIS